jgi:glyoxylase I family protein
MLLIRVPESHVPECVGPGSGPIKNRPDQERGQEMKLNVHHLNLVAGETAGMADFYTRILGMKDMPERHAGRITKDKYQGSTEFVTDGAFEFHLSQKDHNVGFRTGKQVNPLDRGHLAFRTDDLAAFKKLLDDNKIPYSDYGMWGYKGWDQIFFYDPAGNVIEVHQVVE